LSAKAAKKTPAKPKSKRSRKPSKKTGGVRFLVRRVVRWSLSAVVATFAVMIVLVSLVALFNPPITPYAFAESRRLDGINQTWEPLEKIAPVMARSAVAAEDANFCQHWGFDMMAIREALEEGADRGASTITQQVVKNVFLWHGRSWGRKALEALMTPMVEAIWSKRRIVEVYLNVAEFDEGVFGVPAAAQHYFGVAPKDLTATQSARLAAILPDPKGRSASKPSDFVRKRSAGIVDGAATIRVDGRADCFE